MSKETEAMFLLLASTIVGMDGTKLPNGIWNLATNCIMLYEAESKR